MATPTDAIPSVDYLWGAAIAAIGAVAYIFGDKRWARKPENGREYAIAKTEIESRSEREEHERETLRLCDQAYVLRHRYHEDMNVMTGEIQRVREDVNQLSTAFASLQTHIEVLAKHSGEPNLKLSVICEKVASLEGVWVAAWEMKHGAPPRRRITDIDEN